MAQTRGARASVKHVRLSPYKARQVLDLIRGKHVEEARRILQFTPKAASSHIAKVLDSAVANAEHTFRADRDRLYVVRCWADEGPTLKRWQPRALGRAYRLRKRTAHITLEVEQRGGSFGSED